MPSPTKVSCIKKTFSSSFQLSKRPFFLKKTRIRNSKSSFGYVNYDVSWRSPYWKKPEKSPKTTMKMSAMFRSKIEEKTMKKLVAVGITSKFDKMTALGPPFSQKVDFLVDFGDPQGTPGKVDKPYTMWLFLKTHSEIYVSSCNI